jgi:hypothetical protein
MAERAEPAEPETVGVTVSRVTLERLRSLAARWQTSVESVLARLVRDALRTGGPPLPVGGALPPEGLSTDGLDPDEDASWRELHDLTREREAPEERDGSEHAEANAGARSGGAPAR